MLLTVWLAAVGAVVGGLYLTEFSEAERVGEIIARATAKAGSVQLRPEGYSLWSNVAPKQKFVEGDMVSTGPKSRLEIQMTGGRVIEIGPNSQLELSIEGGVGGKGQGLGIVTLLRGSVAVKESVAGGPSEALKIKSGQKVIQLTGQKDALRIARLPGQETAVLDLRVGGKTLVSASEAERAKVEAALRGASGVVPNEEESGLAVEVNAKDLAALTPTPAPTPEVIETPTPEPTPELILAEGLEPRVEGLRENDILWALKSLKGSAEYFTVRLAPPEGKKLPRGWTPMLAVETLSGKREVFEAEVGTKGEVRLSASFIQALPARKGSDQLPEWPMRLVPGARVKQVRKDAPVSWSKQKILVRARSLHAIGEGGMELRLQRVQPDEIVPMWHESHMALGNGAPTQILLRASSDILRLKPFIAGAEAFGVVPSAFDMKGVGVFLVRDREVVSRLRVAGAKPSEIAALAKALGCEMAFLGEGDAYFASRGRQRVSLVQEFQKLLAKDGVVYMSRGTSLVRVNRSFLGTDESVLNFLDQNAAAVFLKSVRIVYWREEG